MFLYKEIYLGNLDFSQKGQQQQQIRLKIPNCEVSFSSSDVHGRVCL